MKKQNTLPNIPEDKQTPLVKELLLKIENLLVEVDTYKETNALLKDQINILKGEKKRPSFKPSKFDEECQANELPDPNAAKKIPTKQTKRAGSEKKKKTPKLVIHDTQTIQPVEIPEGSRFKNYRKVTVQELNIESRNTLYRLAHWITLDNKGITGQLPDVLRNSRFGPNLRAYILYQYHQCQTTEPLIHEQLTEWGVDISTGQIDRILSGKNDKFHSEADYILEEGLKSDYIGVDDTGGRHQGVNGYVTCISNPLFAWFKQTRSKSRANFLTLLTALHGDYILNDAALEYLIKQRFPKSKFPVVTPYKTRYFATKVAWFDYLDSLNITSKKHRATMTEAALMGALDEHQPNLKQIIISDDAGQFDILRHALCWVHIERLVHKLIPLNQQQREDIALVRDQIWGFYRALKTYKAHEIVNKIEKERLRVWFDDIFSQKTSYTVLNRLLLRIKKKKEALLLVLDYPFIPLNTNFVERDIREWVKRRKISGGTRSEQGRRCRDTFTTLKKTCRKLGVSFWFYLLERLGVSVQKIPPLNQIMREKMKAATGY